MSIPAGVTDNDAGVAAALAAAGYDRSGLYFSVKGTVATLVLGYLIGDPPARAAARLVQQQLGAVGIQVNLVALNSTDFFAPLTATSVSDVVLTSTPRGASNRAEAVSVLQCGAAFDPVITTTTSSTSASVPSSGSSTAAAATIPATLCGASVTTGLADYLAGGSISDLDAVAWNDLTVIPLGEPVAVLALGPRLSAVTPPQDMYAMLWGGPLRNLPDWPTPA